MSLQFVFTSRLKHLRPTKTDVIEFLFSFFKSPTFLNFCLCVGTRWLWENTYSNLPTITRDDMSGSVERQPEKSWRERFIHGIMNGKLRNTHKAGRIMKEMKLKTHICLRSVPEKRWRRKVFFTVSFTIFSIRARNQNKSKIEKVDN